ncbi:anti-sigma-K factor RskA [Isoptericola sp. CG 20/1183]|uniref:Regulator of SigK n=1 Tax=Isoptericola halotolerans TaxID=300560 RepID=A0ABX5EFT9_9MICO|nr:MULTISPECIES: anti-sigma factor [Isoptericola]PRZ08268.1 anti-sigma-K factor RskA [Isoptericola halotolerans]PRZ09065.1 anti-sigma-K factor RskA [Isoptericola sp. CG 20/1183]
MPDSTRDSWDLLPAYALDAVDDLERRAVERLLADDAEARRALDEYREVVAAFAVEHEPPAHLRATVMERISASAADGATPAADDGGTAGEAEVVELASRRRRWGVLAVAAAAVVAVAVPTTVAIQATVEQNRLQEQVDTVAEMMADPSATLLRSDVTGGGYATVLAAGDDFLFSAGDLPDVGDDSVYQLWLVGAEGGVTSAGLLEPQDGEVEQLVSDVSGVGLAVSVEPEGGSEQPTTDPIVVLAEG